MPGAFWEPSGMYLDRLFTEAARQNIKAAAAAEPLRKGVPSIKFH
jgi:hypothetical protein